jgi:hypothetical protein
MPRKSPLGGGFGFIQSSDSVADLAALDIPRPFPAKITGNDGAGGYSFQEVTDRVAPTLWTVETGASSVVLGRTGSLTIGAAHEANGIVDVPTGQIVLMYESIIDRTLGQDYRFWLQAPVNWTNQTLTYTSDTINYVSDTLTYTSDTINYNSSTIVFDLNTSITINQALTFVWFTPPQITVNQNNYNIGLHVCLRLSTDVARTITGFDDGLSVAARKGKRITVALVGGGPLTIANENTGSTATNRTHTSTGSDLSLSLDGVVDLEYDDTTQRWRDVGVNQGVASGGGFATNTATEFTGTTVDSPGVVVFDSTNNAGIHGSVAIKNTGANSLTYKGTATDMYGTVSTQSAGLSGATPISFDFDSNTFIGIPPFKEIKLEVFSTVGGTPTTFDIWRSIVG